MDKKFLEKYFARREQTLVYWKRGGLSILYFFPSVFPKNIRELCSEYFQAKVKKYARKNVVPFIW